MVVHVSHVTLQLAEFLYVLVVVLTQQYACVTIVCCMILQVLHVHGFSGVGLHCAYLVVACYLMFSCEFDTFKKSVESLPNPALQLVASSSGTQTPMQRYVS